MSEPGTPTAGDVPVPVKRKRGRPPKPETVARREAEHQQAVAAALAAGLPPPPAPYIAPPAAPKPQQQQPQSPGSTPATRRTGTPSLQQQQQSSHSSVNKAAQPIVRPPPKPVVVIPEPEADDDEVVDVPASTSQPVAAHQVAPQQFQQQQQQHSFAADLGTPALPVHREEIVLAQHHASREQESIEPKQADEIARYYASFREPSLEPAIKLLSSEKPLVNDLYHELSKLSDELRSRATKALPFPPPTKRYVLHRGLPQVDLFSSRALDLKPSELEQLAASTDTDVIEIAHPSLLPKTVPPSFRDIVPSSSTTTSSATRSAAVPKPVEHLYYSPFSSFAPTYDSSHSTLPLAASDFIHPSTYPTGPEYRTVVLDPSEKMALRAIGVDERDIVTALTTTTSSTSTLRQEDEEMRMNVERIKALLTAQRNRLRIGVQPVSSAANGGIATDDYEKRIAKALSLSLTKLIARLGNVSSSSVSDPEDTKLVKSEQAADAIERYKRQLATRGTRGTVDMAQFHNMRGVKMPTQ